jgi:hypothetical protein
LFSTRCSTGEAGGQPNATAANRAQSSFTCSPGSGWQARIRPRILRARKMLLARSVVIPGSRSQNSSI